MSSNIDSQALVQLANEILSQLHVTHRVKTLDDINAAVFVTMYEGLCGDVLQDVVAQPQTTEDEIHNCQAVIDSLSMDILNTSLSHISGQEIVFKNRIALSNLLDVFSGLMEFMMDKIGSDVSSGGENNDMKVDDLEDPDLVTSDLIDDILESELGRRHAPSTRLQTSAPGQMNGTYTEDESTTELMKLGQTGSDWPSSDRTSQLIALGNTTDPTSMSSRENTSREMSSIEVARGGSFASAVSRDRPLSAEEVGSRYKPANHRDKPGNSRERPVKLREKASNSREQAGDFKDKPVNPREKPVDPRDKPVNPKDKSVTSRGIPLHSGDVTSNMRGQPISSSKFSRTRDPPIDLTHDTDVSGSSVANLLKESEDLRRRYQLLHGTSAGSHTAPARLDPGLSRTATKDKSDGDNRSAEQPVRSPPLDNTLGSSVSLPSAHHHDDPGPFRSLGQGPRRDPLSTSLPVSGAGQRSGDARESRHTYEGHIHLYHHGVGGETAPRHVASVDPLSASLPVSLSDRRTEPPQLGSTSSGLAPPTTTSSSQSGKQSNVGQYADLEGVMRDTVSMSRAAIQHSPRTIRAGATSRATSSQDNSSKHRARHQNKPPTLNTSDDLTPKGILSPPRRRNGSRKAVSFKPRSAEKKRLSDTSTDSSHVGSRSAGNRKKVIANDTRSQPGRKVASPHTFREYLHKYYGTSRLPSKPDGDHSDHSEFESEEDQETSIESGPLDKELSAWRDKLRRKARTTTLDHILDDSAPGKMGNMRRKLKTEELQARLRKEFLREVYEDEYSDLQQQMIEELVREREAARDTDTQYKKAVNKPKTLRHKPAKKYTATTRNSSHRPLSKTRPKSVIAPGRKRSVSASPVNRRRMPVRSDDDLLTLLLDEFPYLHISSETLRNLWNRGSKQVEQLARVEQEQKRRKNKQMVQVEEAEKRHEILMNIMKKEMAHNHRQRELEERRKQEQQVKSTVRDKRLQSARCRKYYEDFHVRMRSKMLKKRSREELLFRNLFKEGLDIQRDRIAELRKYAHEERARRAKQQKDEIASLENYYRDQFALLVESMVREKTDTRAREKAQTKAIAQMKTELRKRMEREIGDFQETLWRDEDDVFHRELDAERLKHDLHRASYQVKV